MTLRSPDRSEVAIIGRDLSGAELGLGHPPKVQNASNGYYIVIALPSSQGKHELKLTKGLNTCEIEQLRPICAVCPLQLVTHRPSKKAEEFANLIAAESHRRVVAGMQIPVRRVLAAALGSTQTLGLAEIPMAPLPSRCCLPCRENFRLSRRPSNGPNRLLRRLQTTDENVDRIFARL